MDTTLVFILSGFLLVSVLLYLLFPRNRRQKKVSLKDLYKTSKRKESDIAKIKERRKRGKEDIIKYEMDKKSKTKEISYYDNTGPIINDDYKIETVEANTLIEDIIIDDKNELHNNNTQEEESFFLDYSSIEKLLEESRTDGYKYPDKNIDIITGIGSSYRKRLNRIGIFTISDFVSQAKKVNGIKKINEETGIYTKLLKNWNMRADLFRIQGIRSDQIETLIKIGVSSTKNLADIKSEELQKKLLANIPYPETPTLSMTKRWIRIAKEIVYIDNKN